MDYGGRPHRFGDPAISFLLGPGRQFHDPGRAIRRPHDFLAKHFAFQNWSIALSRLWPHIQNSLLVSAVASVGTLLITAPAAYGLVWRKPRGRRTLMAFMLMTQMLPAIVFVIPLFIVFTKINLVNTLAGLILADMTFTIPFALIMLSAYMKDLPYELVEAALVDGAGQLRAFLMIVLPMTLPGLITVGVFSFLIPWGDLIFALSLITDDGLQPLNPPALQSHGPVRN